MKLKILFVTLLSILFVQAAAAQSTPEEESLHNVYQRYNAQPTSAELWAKALSQRPSQQYTIVKGDTLWDISKTLFADGFFWSKVWSLNPYITNPHQISVGKVIHFYLGSGIDSPVINIKGASSSPAITSRSPISSTSWWKSGNTSADALDLTDVTIPPPSVRTNPVLETLPDSLPGWSFQSDLSAKGTPVEFIETKMTEIENNLNIPFYISDQEVEEVGWIHEIEKNANTASETDFLFIEADQDLQVGSVFTVIKNIGEIHDPEATGELPLSYEVQGEVKIVGMVEGYYKAIVIKSMFPIEVGSQIIAGHSPKMNMTSEGKPAKVQAMIVGGENDTTPNLFGPQSIVYINRGADDGVKVNQQMPIMALHRMRHSDSNIYSNTWKVGELKIVKVEHSYATGVVMEAIDGIMPGDFVGQIANGDLSEKIKEIDESTSFGDNNDSSFHSGGRKPRKERDSTNSNNDSFSSDSGSDSSGDSSEDFEDDSKAAVSEETSADTELDAEFEGDSGTPEGDAKKPSDAKQPSKKEGTEDEDF